MLQAVRTILAVRRRTPATLVWRSFTDDRKQPPSVNDGSSIDPDEKPQDAGTRKTAEKSTQERIPTRLNDLLASMSTDSDLAIVNTVVAKGAKLKNRESDKRRPLAKKSSKANGSTGNELNANAYEAEVLSTIENVAAELGANVEQTKSELLAKLLNRHSGDGEGSPVVGMNDLISSMQIDQMNGSKSHVQPKRSTFVRKSIDSVQNRYNFEGNQSSGMFDGSVRRPSFQRRKSQIDEQSDTAVSVNLFGGSKLGIYPTVDQLDESIDVLQTWSKLQARELQLAVTHPPSNHFQKMSLWTDQGKLWRFPIDNEQGLDDEAKVCFTEHIFLENHLEGWCPSRGPIRHFMELVCVGLSKNPYYSVQQKIDHINWYREYFDQKKELLQQVIIDQQQKPTDGGSVLSTN